MDKLITHCFITAEHLMQTAAWNTTAKAYQSVQTTSRVNSASHAFRHNSYTLHVQL